MGVEVELSKQTPLPSAYVVASRCSSLSRERAVVSAEPRCVLGGLLIGIVFFSVVVDDCMAQSQEESEEMVPVGLWSSSDSQDATVSVHSVLERRRVAALQELGVAEDAILASEIERFQPASDDLSFRVMQFNVLADALSEDGFLVKPVLEEWPFSAGNVPTSSNGEDTFEQLIDEILAARGNESSLELLKAKYDVPASRRNANATTHWSARSLQIQLLVNAAQPDIIVLEELDRYQEIANAFEALGYTSRLKDSEAYKPAHTDGFSDLQEAAAERFCREWPSRGHAFLPHLNSVSKLLAVEQAQLEAPILAAAESLGKRNEVADAKNPSKLGRSWATLQGGSRSLTEADDKLLALEQIDDMGVAVFWRSARFSAEKIDVRTHVGGGGGCISVKLMEKSGRSLTVLGSHLGSGDGPDNEQKRLRQIDVTGQQGWLAWVKQQASEGPTLFCLDANSDPQLTTRDGSASCWRSFHSALGASVWDSHFEVSGIGRKLASLDPPVSSNKVRGPLSEQAKKVGVHAYHLIDHIYFTPGNGFDSGLTYKQHVFEPRQYESRLKALENVQPSLRNPSDHFPVIVDLAFNGQALDGVRNLRPLL